MLDMTMESVAQGVEPGSEVVQVISAMRGGTAEAVLRQIAKGDNTVQCGTRFDPMNETHVTQGRVTLKATGEERTVILKLDRKEGLFLADGDSARCSLKGCQRDGCYQIVVGRHIPTHRIDSLAQNIVGTWLLHGTQWTDRSGNVHVDPCGGRIGDDKSLVFPDLFRRRGPEPGYTPKMCATFWCPAYVGLTDSHIFACIEDVDDARVDRAARAMQAVMSAIRVEEMTVFYMDKGVVHNDDWKWTMRLALLALSLEEQVQLMERNEAVLLDVERRIREKGVRIVLKPMSEVSITKGFEYVATPNGKKITQVLAKRLRESGWDFPEEQLTRYTHHTMGSYWCLLDHVRTQEGIVLSSEISERAVELLERCGMLESLGIPIYRKSGTHQPFHRM